MHAQGIRDHHATAAQYSTPDSLYSTLKDGSGYLHVTPAAIDKCATLWLASTNAITNL